MLEVRAITKSYENQPLLNGVNFRVSAHETVCLLGSSGSGKSTLLRLIAGLEIPESGHILWQDEDLADVPVYKRQFGLMFQDYALFPHRTVAENVAFGLRMQNRPAVEVAERVMEALQRVNMTGFEHRHVTDLSGGEQQRVALARALAPRPRLLMLDEPLGALDRTLKEQLLQDLRQLLHSTGIPAIYVTHDQQEALALADRLLLLHEGRIIQDGSPQHVYDFPANAWVARFLGMENIISGVLASSNPLVAHTSLGDFTCRSAQGLKYRQGQKVQVLLRPGAAVEDGAGLTGNSVQGKVIDAVFAGEGYRVKLLAGGQTLAFRLRRAPTVDENISLVVDIENTLCLVNGDGNG
jgi:spermidine/putrescine transport system ATP-binding protein